LANYTVSYANGSLTVNPAALSITANSASKNYGTTLTFAGTEFKTTGLLNSDAVTSVTLNSSGATSTATVAGGPYSIIPTAAVGTGLANYTVSYANGSLSVSPAALTITANNATKSYGTLLTFAGSEFKTTGLLNSDAVTSVTLNSTGTLATATVAGGPYSIIPTAAVGTGLANYTVSYANGSLTVNGSPLNVTANNAIMVYGSALPTLSGSLAGVLNNDNIVVSYSTTATSTSPVSASGYPIIASLTGAALSNYTLTNTPGTLTITQDTPTLLLSASSTAATPGQAVTFTAKVTSTTSGVPDGTVVFYDSGTAIGSAILVNGTASLSTSALLPGINNTITASYGGCTSFSKVSSSSLLAINVSPLDFTISITGPNYATVVPGSSVTYQVTVTPLYVSYAGTVSFAVTGLPSGYAVTFSPSSISTNSGAQTISVTITTPSATAKAQPASTLGRRAVPFILALLLLPLAGASRIRQQGRRMSRWMFLLLVLCGMTAASALSGCGGGFFQKPVHNYTVTITATGGGLEHSIPVTLQVQ
jgi:hypothetical protein